MRTKKEINYKVWEEFPSPLFTIDVPGYLSSAIEHLDTLPSNNILHNKELYELSYFFLQTSINYSNQLLKHNPENIKISNSKLLKFTKKNKVIIKSNKTTYLNGLFYYGEGDIDNPHAQFHNPNNYSLKSDSFDSQYTIPYRTIIFKPGRLIIYPSFINLSFSENKSKKNINYLSFKLQANVQEK